MVTMSKEYNREYLHRYYHTVLKLDETRLEKRLQYIRSKNKKYRECAKFPFFNITTTEELNKDIAFNSNVH